MKDLSGFADVIHHVDQMNTKACRALFIGITGLGGAGKTSLMQKLSHHYADRATCLSLDYFAYPTLDRKQRIANAVGADAIRTAENPQNWYDWQKIYQALDDLRAGKTVSLTTAWNQKTGLCDLKVEFHPAEHVFVECIYLGHPEIRQRLDCVLLVDIPIAMAIERQKARDAHRSDPAYLDFKARLAQDYARPYLDRHSGVFDWRISALLPL